jgi:hypothetical protein
VKYGVSPRADMVLLSLFVVDSSFIADGRVNIGFITCLLSVRETTFLGMYGLALNLRWLTDGAYATDFLLSETVEKFLSLLLLKCMHMILEHFALEKALMFMFKAFEVDVLWVDGKDVSAKSSEGNILA